MIEVIGDARFLRGLTAYQLAEACSLELITMEELIVNAPSLNQAGAEILVKVIIARREHGETFYGVH